MVPLVAAQLMSFLQLSLFLPSAEIAWLPFDTTNIHGPTRMCLTIVRFRAEHVEALIVKVNVIILNFELRNRVRASPMRSCSEIGDSREKAPRAATHHHLL